MADAFELRDFTADNLYAVLQNEWLPATDVANNRHAQYLANYLEEVGAKTIVAELDYVDADYLDDYASYYARCFQSYKRRCRRIHFFSRAFDVAQFLGAIHGGSDDATGMSRSLPLSTMLWHDAEFKVAMRAYFEMEPIRDLLIHYLTRQFFDALRKSALA